MTARHFALILCALAAAAGCSREDGGQDPAGAAETRSYLQKAGGIAALAAEENKVRIPAMIRGQDVSMLVGESAAMDGYIRSLAALGPQGVDPEALRFVENFKGVLAGYKSLCLDTAELFREIKDARSRQQGPGGPLPTIRYGPGANQSDTIGTIDSMLDSLNRMDTASREGAVFLDPIVERVRDDRDKLRSAKAAHHESTLKLKERLAQRYPGTKWTSKEMLP